MLDKTSSLLVSRYLYVDSFLQHIRHALGCCQIRMNIKTSTQKCLNDSGKGTRSNLKGIRKNQTFFHHQIQNRKKKGCYKHTQQYQNKPVHLYSGLISF